MTNSNVLFCVCVHLDDSGIKHLHSVVLTAVRQSGIYFNCRFWSFWCSVSKLRADFWCVFCPDAEQSETVTSVNTCNLFVLVFVQSCMRSSCPEPRRSGGVTVKPARSTTARAVRHGAGPTSYIAQRSGPNSNNMLNSFLFVCFLVEGASLADRESSLDLIKLDISRTFPSLFIFQKVTFNFQILFSCLHLPPLSDESALHTSSSLLSAGRSVPRPPPQCFRSVHLLQTRHRIREFTFFFHDEKKTWKQVMSRYTQRELIIL